MQQPAKPRNQTYRALAFFADFSMQFQAGIVIHSPVQGGFSPGVNSGCAGCGCNGAFPPAMSPPVNAGAGASPQASQAPLLRIRAGIEAGNHAEVMAGVREADQQGVVLAQNVRDMISQWLSVNAPKNEPENPSPPAPPASVPEPAPPPGPQSKPKEPAAPATTAEQLRSALLRFFELAPKGSDGAAGLGIIEGDDGRRYLPLPMLGRAVGITGEDFEVAMKAWNVVNETPPGTFMMTEDARAVGLVEWAGWEEFASSLDVIVKGTRDPAFEPRSIQGHVARAARGAVRSGPLRQPDVLRRLQELSSENLPEDAAPALRSAILRRARLALACLVDAIASQGLGPQAGVDSMGLVGQLPRTLFGIIFDNIDDRDRGACAFLGEILQSWDRRRCFSKRWLQDAAGKFSMPKGANSERDERRGWYALTSENLHKKPAEEEGGAAGNAQTFLSTDDAPRPEAGPPEPTKKDSRRRGHGRAVVGAVGEVAAGEVGAGVVGAGAVGARAEVQKALAKKKRAKRKKQSLRKRLRKRLRKTRLQRRKPKQVQQKELTVKQRRRDESCNKTMMMMMRRSRSVWRKADDDEPPCWPSTRRARIRVQSQESKFQRISEQLRAYIRAQKTMIDAINAAVASEAKPTDSSEPVVEEIYAKLKESGFDSKQVTTLEFNSFLERKLWPGFEAEKASLAHLITIALLINEKVRDGSVSAWDSVAARKEKFSGYFESMLELWKSGRLTLREKSHVLQFLINCFQSLEQDFVRECCLRLTGLQSWFHLNDLHREKLLSLNKKLPAFWKKVQKKYADPKTPQAKHERNFMSELLDEFLASLEKFGELTDLGIEELSYLERCIELMIDLLDQLPTRRFFRPLLVDKHVVVRCRGSKVAQLPQARLVNQLLGILRYYENFEIDDTTGKPLSRREVTDLHYERLQLLQRVCFQEFSDNPSLKQIMLVNVAKLDTREALLEHFEPLPFEVLKVLCAKVCYLDVSRDTTLAAMEQKVRDAIAAQEAQEAEKDAAAEPKKKKRKKKVKTEEEERICKLLVEILVNRLERPVMQQDDVMKMPLYPTEDLIWDPNLVPEEHYSGDYTLALPKLNLQFLTIHDYLLRNFNLFRLESTHEIRDDLQDQIPRMKASADHDGGTHFSGSGRMMVPLGGLEVMNVKRPKVGEEVPSEVRAEVRWSLTGVLPQIREEWDTLREHDVIFLIRIKAPEEPYDGKVADLTVAEFPEKFGVVSVRGAEITELLDDEGNVISDPNPAERKTPVGDGRVARVILDPAQYHQDLEAMASGKTEIYSNLNLVLRRKPSRACKKRQQQPV
eukprot:s1106_g2.t3